MERRGKIHLLAQWSLREAEVAEGEAPAWMVGAAAVEAAVAEKGLKAKGTTAELALDGRTLLVVAAEQAQAFSSRAMAVLANNRQSQAQQCGMLAAAAVGYPRITAQGKVVPVGKAVAGKAVGTRQTPPLEWQTLGAAAVLVGRTAARLLGKTVGPASLSSDIRRTMQSRKAPRAHQL